MSDAPDGDSEDPEAWISARTLRGMDRALKRVQADEVGEEFDPAVLESPEDASREDDRRLEQKHGG